MKELKIPKTTFNVELTLEEVEYINGWSRNYGGENPALEPTDAKRIRLALFVGTSQLLGINMDDDGTVTE